MLKVSSEGAKLKNNLKYHPKEQKTNNRYSEGAEAEEQ